MKAWAENLGGITYPLLSDFWPHGDTAAKFGVLRKEGYSERAIFIIDPDGIIRYIDIHEISDQPSNEILFAELAKINPVAAKRMAAAALPESDLPHGGVVMYCTSWCPDCRRAREWFKTRNISYIEVDIEKNTRAAAQVRAWANGNQTTPTFDIDGTVIVNFDEKKLRSTLKI